MHLYDKYLRARELQLLLPRVLCYQPSARALEGRGQGPDELWCLGQVLPSVCFCMACELRMLFTVVEFYNTKKKDDSAGETINGSESLKYLPSAGKVCSNG